MKRMALVFAGGAIWLFLATIPVFADNGPDIAAVSRDPRPAGHPVRRS